MVIFKNLAKCLFAIITTYSYKEVRSNQNFPWGKCKSSEKVFCNIFGYYYLHKNHMLELNNAMRSTFTKGIYKDL